MSTVNEKMTAIADNIRSYTGETEKLSLDDIAESIEKVYAKGQDSGGGYDEGYEAGQQAEYNRFWDSYQGTKTNYVYGFAGSGWNDETFKPKYPLNNMRYAEAMFCNAYITNLNVDIDTSNLVGAAGDMFKYSKIETIKSFKFSSTIALPYAFRSANMLKNITIVGEIPFSTRFNACPLTHDSLMSIINALKDVSSTKEPITTEDFELGGIESNGLSDFDANNRIRTGQIDCTTDKPISIICNENAKWLVHFYNNGTWIGKTSFTSEGCENVVQLSGTPNNVTHIRIVVAYVSDANITDFDDLLNNITIARWLDSRRTLTLGTDNLAKLTDTEKAIATEKGWALA